MDNYINSRTSFNSFAASSSAAQVLAAESGKREGLIIYNASSDNLYCLIDGVATTSNYSFRLTTNTYYEMPKSYFTDKVTGIWDGTNGGAKVTEIKRN